MIKIDKISKTFNNYQSMVVNSVSFTVKEGETVVLLGSSGSGKTTLLKMINRLIEPSEGTIELDNKNIKQYKPVILRRSIGYVFQQIGLFPHMTVERNVSIVLKLRHHSKQEREQKARELLELVHLNPAQFAKRYPNELSGGQRQRVGVARALAANPKYLLMDEPFGAVDAIARNSLQDEMIKLNKKLNKTIVFVTHDVTEAFRIADRIAIFHRGNLEQIGTKEELINAPKSDFVQRLIKTSIKSLENLENDK